MLARRSGGAALPSCAGLMPGLLLGCALSFGGCAASSDNGFTGSVELGDDFVAPDLQLDDDFFLCRIQPEVLTRHSCATGATGESGSCHDSRSALRLVDTDAASPCDGDGRVVGAIPDAYARNLRAVPFSVQSDPLTSPLYLRPLGRASHPRTIFDEGDAAADLIIRWISGEGP
jgi:hypothetical protein